MICQIRKHHAYHYQGSLLIDHGLSNGWCWNNGKSSIPKTK